HNIEGYVKKICMIAVLYVLLYAQPTTARFWGYANMTAVLTNNWVFVVMPGLRYEFLRDDGMNSPAKKLYFTELLTGPVYTMRHQCITLKLPVWYYYMGFPVSTADDYFYSHNIEFLPIIEYRVNKLKVTSRTIFHNTVYASIYETPALRNGYGLVIRQLFRADYSVSNTVSIMAGEEPFFGVIEDSEAPPHVLGFWPAGFHMNRLYTGCTIQLNRSMTISPQYVFETTYGDDVELAGINHYFHFIVTWIVRF
ncbi:MAG: DUF2490 domain-containing protein, partial [candidate division WOR-3 bacterium]